MVGLVRKKNLAVLLAVATIATACGGGGGTGSGGGMAGGGGEKNHGGPAPTNPMPPAPPANAPINPVQVDDQQLKGHLQVVANQVVFIQDDRKHPYGERYASYNAAPIEYFADPGADQGLHIAAGGTEADMNKEVPPSVIAPAAPIASFGIRVLNVVQSDTGGAELGAQQVVGRVAFDLVEVAGSGGIQPGEGAERRTFVIDRVELATDANGNLISARVLDGAQLHVYGMTANGQEVRDTISAPPDSVRLMPVQSVIDNYGDNSSVVLLMDLEQAFSQAGERLSALHNLRGQFDMSLTLSTAKIIRPGETRDGVQVLERRDLVGESIQVNDQPAVNGAGVKGKVWIRRSQS